MGFPMVFQIIPALHMVFSASGLVAPCSSHPFAQQRHRRRGDGRLGGARACGHRLVQRRRVGQRHNQRDGERHVQRGRTG